MHGQRDIVAGVAIDDIEPNLAGAQHGRAMPTAVVADVRLVHGAGLHRRLPGHRLVRRPDRRLAAVVVGGAGAVMGELDRGERAVVVHGLGHQRQRGHVAVVPQSGFGKGQDVAGRMDVAFLRRDDGPAALGLDAAHGRLGARHDMAHAGAVRHLIEAVSGRLRADLHRLEQDVVTRVARHCFLTG